MTWKNGLAYTVIGLVVLGFFVFASYKQSTYPPRPANNRPPLALRPPMGWNGWNHFRCSPKLNEKTFKEIVDTIVGTGMRDAGYQYVSLDDCWQIGRGADGQIIVDPERFPSGIKALATYVHERDMFFGIYTSAGRLTCEKRPGSYGYEYIDTTTYASWGVDYIKVDWCGIEYLDTQTQYRVWSDAIKQTGRPMVLNIAIAAIETIENNAVWEWGHGVADSWRTARDLLDFWDDILRVADINTRYADYSRIGGWNDADMMQVGNGGMDLESYRSHFSLWSMMSSPLIAGNDVREMSPEIIKILTNKEVISINQDPLGEQAKVVAESDGVQVWVKRLYHRGDRAVGVLNRSEQEKTYYLHWSDLKLLPIVFYRDLWAEKPRWQFSNGSLKITLRPHQIMLLRVSGVDS